MMDHFGRPLREYNFSADGHHVHAGEPLADRPATLEERADAGDLGAQRVLAERAARQQHNTTKG